MRNTRAMRYIVRRAIWQRAKESSIYQTFREHVCNTRCIYIRTTVEARMCWCLFASAPSSFHLSFHCFSPLFPFLSLEI